MSVTPSVESLQLAVELIKAGKFSDNKVIPVAAMFDAYLCGDVVAEVSFDTDGRPVVEMRPREETPKPEEPAAAPKPEERATAGNLTAPAMALCDNLSDEDLRSLESYRTPYNLACLLSNLASEELHRRWEREEEPGSDIGYGYTGSPDLGEVGA